jgi:hypothetical protein
MNAIKALFDPPAICSKLNLTHFVDCYATARWWGSDQADHVWINLRSGFRRRNTQICGCGPSSCIYWIWLSESFL